MPIIYEPKGRAREYSHLAINHYVGCDHKCKYCYVAGMPQWKDKDFFATPARPRAGVLDMLESEVPKYAGTNKRVLLCFAGDPYPLVETELFLTQKILKLLRDNDIQFQILTKSGTRAAIDFCRYGPDDAFAVTMTLLDEAQSKEIEPGAALPQDRIKALQMAKVWQIRTWVSLEPVIDAEQSLEIIRQTHQFTDLYKIGKMNHQKSNIDWRKFGIAAVKLCRELKKDYYIKRDLAEYMTDFRFHSIDTRIVKK